jgi:hypothetical protein
VATSTRAPAPKRTSDPVTPKPEFEVTVGVPAYLPFTTPYKNAWEALRHDEVTVKQLQAMRRTDGQARALYRLITLPIRAALKTATYVPESHVDGGEEEAAFIEQMFTLPQSSGGMSVPFGRVIAQMLMAIFDGFAAFEMVYTSPGTGPLKGKWTLKELAHRPAETLTFLLDDKGKWAGLRQQTMFHGRHIDKTIDAAHAVYYAANEEERAFYGRSYFETAFWHWDKKFKLYIIAHLAAQRAAVGTRVGKLPPNPSKQEKTDFKKALADLGIAQYMTIPADYVVDSLKEAGDYDFLSIINHHNSQMSKSILAAFFDKEQGAGAGGAKLVDFGQQSDALFLLMLQTIMGEIEEVVNNRIIPRFIDWNFGSGKYPRFQFGSLSDAQKEAMLELFKTLATGGQSLTCRPELVHELEVQVSELFGLEMDWESIEAEMAEEKALEAEMAAAGMVPGADPGAPAGAGGGAPGGAPPAPEGSPVVDPALLPPGFTLSQADDEALELTADAIGLLAEAAADLGIVELVRGRPNSGGPKFVRSPEGARVYGVPIGSPITRDVRERTAKEGVKGKPFGGGTRDPFAGGKAKKTPTGRAVYGGGPGAPSNLGGVVTDPNAIVPVRTLSHPDQPGAVLLDFGDGTVAVRDASGRTSPRQRFDVAQFLKLGWQVERRHTTASSAQKGKPKVGVRSKPGRSSRPAPA